LEKRDIYEKVKAFVKENNVSVIPFDSTLYPESLRSFSKHPEVIYSKGNLDLLSTPSVSIVGTRKPTELGKQIAADLSRFLLNEDITIVSGLAEGIDISAQLSTIRNKGRTIAVIGTPINQYYPKKHQMVQDFIAQNNLLISQVSFLQYESESFQAHRNHFLERNVLMAAISDATVLIEVGETSGTRTQAKACLKNMKPLFIHRNLLNVRPNIKWIEELIERGAKVIDDNYQEILTAVSKQFDNRTTTSQTSPEQEYLNFG
jgi:DNA processing protein